MYTLVYSGYNADANITGATGTRLFLAAVRVARGDARGDGRRRSTEVLAGGQFPAALEPTIVTAVNAVTLSALRPQRANRVRMAVYLMASSYDYQVQR